MGISPINIWAQELLDSKLAEAVADNNEYRAQQLAQDQAAFERWWRPDTPENRERLEQSYSRRMTGPYVHIGYTP